MYLEPRPSLLIKMHFLIPHVIPHVHTVCRVFAMSVIPLPRKRITASDVHQHAVQYSWVIDKWREWVINDTALQAQIAAGSQLTPEARGEYERLRSSVRQVILETYATHIDPELNQKVG